MNTFCFLCKTKQHCILQENCDAKTEKPYLNITTFKGKNSELSNFYPCTIFFRDHYFQSSEHVYQYMKCVINNRMDLANKIPNIKEAFEVKCLVKHVRLNGRWQTEKEDIMFEIIKAKAKHSREYYEALKNSKEIIVEAVPFDRYWSVGLDTTQILNTKMHYWPGRNRMGELHMKLRKELFGH